MGNDGLNVLPTLIHLSTVDFLIKTYKYMEMPKYFDEFYTYLTVSPLSIRHGVI